MKSYQEPIDVEVDDGGKIALPTALHWRRQRFRVHKLIDRWVLQSRWWEREEKRVYLLMEVLPERAPETKGAASQPLATTTIEIYRNDYGWVLSRVVD
ncbi:MAG: hypothetical protein VX733_09660 [Candidatus Latescibacterota bacterium]|nr:hypothetical protein [Candidatus Latescibacterota bacterium]